MKIISRKTVKYAFVSVAALACFSLVVFFSTRGPGSAQTAFAETKPASSIPADSISVLEAMQKANRSVSQAILPVVVTIDVVETKTVEESPMNVLPWFFGNPNGGKGDGNGDDTQKREYKATGLGSGIIVRRDGKKYYVLTNQHVAGSANEITINLSDGRDFAGKLVGSDERKDIALVSFESDDASIPVAKLGDSSSVQTGDIVFAVGAPLGYMSSVTQGIVSAVGRDGGPNNNINDFIQTDAAINQGNSGGPLVNIYGEVVGINSWIASSSGGSQGLGFSIPINNVKKAVDDFISGGKVVYGWLGVQLYAADDDMKLSLGLKDSKVEGAFVRQVFSGSPADKSGLLPGDFVLSLDGKKVKNVEQLTRDVGDLVSGQSAAFRLVRNGKEQTVTVKIEARDETTVSDSTKLWPGFGAYPVTDDFRKQLKLAAGQKGVVVLDVYTKSAAAVIGLQGGDVIEKVNGKAVADLGEFYAALSDKTQKETWFDVLRDGQEISTMRYKRK
jgi:serine protease Do